MIMRHFKKLHYPSARIFQVLAILISACLVCIGVSIAQTKTEKTTIDEPIMVNGDTVEYSTDNKEITASGNVKVVYKGTTLTCNKLSVNTQTKEGKAEGDVKIEDAKGTIEGQKIVYNFQNKTGVFIDADFKYPPFFGKAKKIERLSESEFVAYDGYSTSCNLDHPHYRIKSKKIRIFPQDKIQTTNNVFCVGPVPLMYLPKYNKSLKDPLYHVQLTPGSSGDWGAYMLSAWRYELSDNIKGRIYLDYRAKLGVAEGFGTNYKTENFGRGDLKYYYTHERPDELRKSTLYKDKPYEFQRYLIRLRHRWEMDERTNAVAEYYKIEDSKRQIDITNNFLKDYFYREYEKDAQPKSYLSIDHNFNYSNISLFVQKRTNRWYDHSAPDEKLPEITYELPEYNIGESPLYFKNTTIFSNLNNKYPVPSDLDDDVVRLDTYNQLSLPFRASIFSLTPFAGIRDTAYSKDKNGDYINPRTTHYSGLDLSTKLYRLFDVNSNFMGLDLNGIRHIITPTAKYAYNHEPTIPFAKLQQFDAIDSIVTSNKVSLELVNKFQTKRSNNNKVDFATFKVNTDYSFKPKGGTGSSFSDFLFDLELIPYSWLRVESDAAYDHVYDNFKSANVDLYADFGKERTFGIGHRYERKGGKELTTEFTCRLSPKWRFKIYERYQFAAVKGRGLKEQEYSFLRDLHCWEADFTYNIDKERGHTVWLIFRLKAFPETELKIDQNYHAPKVNTSSNRDALVQ